VFRSRQRAAAAAARTAAGFFHIALDLLPDFTLIQAASAVAPLIQGISTKAELCSGGGAASGGSITSRSSLYQSIHSEVTRTFAVSRAKVNFPRHVHLLSLFKQRIGAGGAAPSAGCFRRRRLS
jgi:hypothetical protein